MAIFPCTTCGLTVSDVRGGECPICHRKPPPLPPTNDAAMRLSRRAKQERPVGRRAIVLLLAIAWLWLLVVKPNIAIPLYLLLKLIGSLPIPKK